MRITGLMLVLMVIFTDTIKAQQFDRKEAELGVIIDNQGVVSQQFLFKNQSSDTIQLQRVNTSCGCTSTNWSVGAIPPGGAGFVEVELDPFNRPGPFEKYAYVFFKHRSDSLTLKINGFIKPGTESISEAFPVKMGDLRVLSTSLNLGTITKKSMFSKSFEVYNESDQILVFADDMEGPNHITATFEPYTLKPQSKGKVWIHYDVNAKNDLGYFQEEITISTYESENAQKNFTVFTTILDLPSKGSGASPKAYIVDKEKDFGIKQQGDTVNVQFKVMNQGRSSLQLKKVFGNCNCIRVRPEKFEIDPGEAAAIDVRFLTHDRLGNQEKTVTLFTDDPNMPVAILKLKGRLRGPRN